MVNAQVESSTNRFPLRTKACRVLASGWNPEALKPRPLSVTVNAKRAERRVLKQGGHLERARMPLPGQAGQRWWDGDRDQVVSTQVVSGADLGLMPGKSSPGAATEEPQRARSVPCASHCCCCGSFLNPWGHEVHESWGRPVTQYKVVPLPVRQSEGRQDGA